MKESNNDKLHAHWRATFSKDLRESLSAKSMDSAPILLAPENESDQARGHSYHQTESMWAKRTNFDQKIYWFPPHYNELRRELVEHWPALWALSAYRMVYLPEEFSEFMNEATDLRVQFDSGAVDWMCQQWLDALIRLRLGKLRNIDGSV